MRLKTPVVLIFVMSLLLTSCTTQKRLQYSELTPIQKAEYTLKEGKRSEAVYETVVLMLKAAHTSYKASPNQDTLEELKKMYAIHKDAKKAYDAYVPIQHELTELVAFYRVSGGNVNTLLLLIDRLSVLATELILQSTFK